jgi:uncharacterized membrane protein
MHTPASIAGHPIHPMLIPIPIGLWIFSFVADILCMSGARPGPDTWATIAYYSMIGGILGALLAALPGLIDLISLKERALKKTALIHMGINLTIVVLYIINVSMRTGTPERLEFPMLLSTVSILMLLVSGWLGGKLVYEGRVAVMERPPGM